MKSTSFMLRRKALFFGLTALMFSACAGESAEPLTEEKPEEEPLVPIEVVKLFVMALADGECKDAKDMTTGTARELVQGQIDAGCMKYQTGIKSVECNETGETAADKVECECVEVREGGMGEMVYDYSLEKVDGEWKVANYQKDFGQDESDTTGSSSDIESAAACDLGEVCDGASAGACESGACDMGAEGK